MAGGSRRLCVAPSVAKPAGHRPPTRSGGGCAPIKGIRYEVLGVVVFIPNTKLTAAAVWCFFGWWGAILRSIVVALRYGESVDCGGVAGWQAGAGV